MIDYLRISKKYEIPKNIISNYDKLKEPVKVYKYISKEQIIKLSDAIKGINENKYMQYKMVLILTLDTGRRIHEILCLEYDCLVGNIIYFDKTKQGERYQQVAGEASMKAILKLKEYAKKIERELYSQYDGRMCRRLFPSMYKNGLSILSEDSILDF